MVQNAEHTNNRGWFNGFYLTIEFGLVVKAHISARNRCFKPETRFTHTFDDVDKLPVHLLVVRIAKIESVGDGNGLGPTTDDVARGFGNGDHSSLIRVGIYIVGITIHAHGQCFVRSLYSYGRSI